MDRPIMSIIDGAGSGPGELGRLFRPRIASGLELLLNIRYRLRSFMGC